MADPDIMRQDDEGPRPQPQRRSMPARFERPDPHRIERLRERRNAPLRTPSYLSPSAVREVSAGLTTLLADMFALYIKTKNFHWHVSGPGFRDHHLLLDEQAKQIFDTTDLIAERARKLGGLTLRSVGQISRLSHILDNDATYVPALAMLAELRDDNETLVAHLSAVRDLVDEYGDYATASMIDAWTDEAQQRIWMLFESTQRWGGPG